MGGFRIYLALLYGILPFRFCELDGSFPLVRVVCSNAAPPNESHCSFGAQLTAAFVAVSVCDIKPNQRSDLQCEMIAHKRIMKARCSDVREFSTTLKPPENRWTDRNGDGQQPSINPARLQTLDQEHHRECLWFER